VVDLVEGSRKKEVVVLVASRKEASVNFLHLESILRHGTLSLTVCLSQELLLDLQDPDSKRESRHPGSRFRE
jgi:hypothetical protein